MDRFYCYLAGFAIALALVAGFCIVKIVVEEYKEKRDRYIRNAVYAEMLKEREWLREYIETAVPLLIDDKLAEKEGEHETAEL